MSTFVLVSAAFAVLALGATVVAGLGLLRAAQGLSAARSAVMERLGPLTAELTAEQAVTALELDALRLAAERGKSGSPQKAP